MKKRIFTTLIILTLGLTACGRSQNNDTTQDNNSTENNSTVQNNNTGSEISTTNSTETITAAGTYVLSGDITNQAVTVAATSNDKVEIVLDNVTIKNKTGPALYIKSAGEVILTAKDGTTNYLSDGSSYTMTSGQETIDGAIFSNCNLTINGGGTLYVSGNYENGIVSNSNLNIAVGTLNVEAQKSAIDADNNLTISDGHVTIRKSREGLESDHILISGGRTLIDVTEDSIDSDDALEVTGGVLVALGSLDIEQHITNSDTQTVMISTFSKQNGGNSFLVSDKDNHVIVSFTPENAYESAIVSAPAINAETTHSIIVGATVSDADSNGFALDSTYTGGTKIDFTNLSTQMQNR